MRSKNLIYISIIVGFLILIILFFYNQKNYKDIMSKTANDSHYVVKENELFEYGITKKKTNLYRKINNKYSIIGTIEKNTRLHFSKLIDNYLLINNLEEEYYVKMNDVENSDSLTEENSRYKDYIVFNENIITNTPTNFYNEQGELVYSINKSYIFPIIIKDIDKYGIEYDNQLMYIKKEDVIKTTENKNTQKTNSSGVGVLNYHFFYDEENKKEKKECNQAICISKSQLKEEIDYIKENNILTITANELELYIDGKINLPKSVLITIDDGYMMNLGINMFEENQMYACVFLITSWFDNVYFLNNYKYIEFHSHGENLHTVGICPNDQGGGIKCLPRDTLLNDLKTSRNKLNGSTFFAYPFYEYNIYSINILKEAGITLAFAGESSYSDNLVHVGSNKYTLPRFIMVNYTTIENLKNYFNNIH